MFGSSRSGRPRDGGQGLAEYALILALIAVIAIAALFVLGDQITAVLNAISETL